MGLRPIKVDEDALGAMGLGFIAPLYCDFRAWSGWRTRSS